uniref:Uncharacterized protein n=1 Tax=Anopheles christyi TaxID=43041 RepID=A0A182K7L5_9DIPT
MPTTSRSSTRTEVCWVSICRWVRLISIPTEVAASLVAE